ncbi:MAG: hypothetical protein OXI84_10940 [bacterium]|nr:hypothetical protein [bacterium]
MHEHLGLRRTFTAAAVLAAALLAGACSGDSESDPTTTSSAPATTTTTTSPATTTTTSAPAITTTTAAPATTTTTEPEETEPAAQPSGALADFFVDASTTYQDVMDRVSEHERECIKAALGEMVYNIFLTRPVLSEDGEDAGRDPSLVTRLFSCLTQDNVVLAMIVLRDATAGRMDEEARRCRVPLALQIPESYHEQAGLEWEGERVPAKELAEINSRILECFSEEEVAALQFRVYQQLVEMVSIELGDVIGAFTDAEQDCFRERIGADEFAAILDSPLRDAGAMADHELHEACFTRDTPGRLYAAYVGLLLDSAARAEYLQDGYRLHSCLNDDESERWNNLYFEAFQQS